MDDSKYKLFIGQPWELMGLNDKQINDNKNFVLVEETDDEIRLILPKEVINHGTNRITITDVDQLGEVLLTQLSNIFEMDNNKKNKIMH